MVTCHLAILSRSSFLIATTRFRRTTLEINLDVLTPYLEHPVTIAAAVLLFATIVRNTRALGVAH